MAAARERILDAAGQAVGNLVETTISGAGRLTFAYVADPEGNGIELQLWEP